MEIETATWSKFRNGGKATAEQILKSRNKSNEQDWESQSVIQVWNVTIWVSSLEIEKW